MYQPSRPHHCRLQLLLITKMARLEADFDHLPHGRRYFGELAYTAKFKIRDPRSRSQGSCASCAREGSRGNFGQSAAPNSACEDCVKALRHGTQKALHLESELLLGSVSFSFSTYDYAVCISVRMVAFRITPKTPAPHARNSRQLIICSSILRLRRRSASSP